MVDSNDHPPTGANRLKTLFLGLGSNIGDREASLRTALAALESKELRLLRTSSLYETEPVGFRDQAWFLNMVAEFECDLLPAVLLARTQRIEREMGRRKTVLNGPRIIDIDILLYGTAVIHRPDLVVPHPRYHERLFVLEPLVELAPDLRDPSTGKPVKEMLSQARRGPDKVLRYS